MKEFYHSLYIRVKNIRITRYRIENVKKKKNYSAVSTIIVFTRMAKKRERLRYIHSVGSEGQLLRGNWAIAFNIRTSCEAGPSAPCSLHGAAAAAAAATIAKMYRPIKMDSRFDPVHIIFHARRIRRYCDIHRGGGGRGGPGKSHRWKSASLNDERRLARLMRFYRSAIQAEIFNEIRLVERSH